MTYDLAALVRHQRNVRRPTIALREFKAPRSLEAELKESGLAIVREWRRAVKDGLLPLLEGEGLVTDNTEGVDRWFEREESRVSGLVATILPGHRRWMLRVEEWHRRRWAGSVKAGTGLSVEGFLVPLGTDNRVQASLREAANLIRSIEDETRKRVQQLTYSALVEGRSRRDLSKELTKVFGIERRRALTIARDQTTKLAGTLNRLRNEEAGITTYEWVHSGKVNFREEHLARDGTRYEWDDPPSDGHPGFAINCGCTSRAVLEFE